MSDRPSLGIYAWWVGVVLHTTCSLRIVVLMREETNPGGRRMSSPFLLTRLTFVTTISWYFTPAKTHPLLIYIYSAVSFESWIQFVWKMGMFCYVMGKNARKLEWEWLRPNIWRTLFSLFMGGNSQKTDDRACLEKPILEGCVPNRCRPLPWPCLVLYLLEYTTASFCRLLESCRIRC